MFEAKHKTCDEVASDPYTSHSMDVFFLTPLPPKRLWFFHSKLVLKKWHCACVLWRGYCFPSAPRMQIRDSLPTWLIFVPLFRVHPASVSLAWLTPSLFSVLYGSVQSKHRDCVLGISVHSLVLSSSVTPGVLTFMDLSLVSFLDRGTAGLLINTLHQICDSYV